MAGPSTVFAASLVSGSSGDASTGEATSVLFLLVLSKVCLDFARKYVRQTVETTAAMFRVRASMRRGRKGDVPQEAPVSSKVGWVGGWGEGVRDKGGCRLIRCQSFI